jgi:hypothetical protein
MSAEPQRENHADDWRNDPALWAQYEKAKREVTEEEKRAFAIEEPLIPFDQVVEELEALRRQLKSREAKG